MQNLNAVKSGEFLSFNIEHPILIQRPEKMIDIKQFFKNYARESLKLAIEEYHLESAFNVFQPKFILCEYNKDARKFGVKAKPINDPYTISDHKMQIKADMLSFAADLCALYVINHKNEYSGNAHADALNFIKRNEQYELDEYYLGFGYFIKDVCSNGHYAAIAITDWFDQYLIKDDIVFSIIVKELQMISVSDSANAYNNPKKINFICTYLFDEFTNPRLLEINGNFNKRSFSLSSEQKKESINFLNLKISVNLDEIFDLLANH